MTAELVGQQRLFWREASLLSEKVLVIDLV
jgi:hypothetical protein